MDRLRGIEIFVEVALGKSFSSAARRLGISRAAVSKNIAQLEKALGAQLLVRTTKSVNLTEAGRSVLQEARGIVQQFNRVEDALRNSISRPKGSIHIGSPPPFAEIHLMPLICGFLSRNPGIDIKLHLDYGREDVIAEGLDLTFRITPAIKDTSLIAQRLTSVPQTLVASPQYLRTREAPKTPRDLLQHSCLVHLLKSPNSVWTLDGPNGTESVQVSGPIRANFGEVLRQGALLHKGISLHPVYMVAQDIREERLKIVLPEYSPNRLEVFILYPSRQNLPLRVRSFIEYMKNCFDVSGHLAAHPYLPEASFAN